MQTYHVPKLNHAEASNLWRVMWAHITERKIDATPMVYTGLKTFSFSAALAACLTVTWTTPSIAILIIFSIVIAFLLAQFAFIGHDAGHSSLNRHEWTRSLLGQWCMTIVTGLCFEEWYARHSKHHRFCQDESHDPDMDVAIVVSLTSQARAQKVGVGRWMSRYQHLHVWFLSIFFAYSQRHLSQWGALVNPRKYGRDLSALVLHFSLWFWLPIWAFDVAPERAFLVYMLPMLVLGPYLASIFWLNHIGMPLIDSSQPISFLEHQAISSRTVISPKAMDWFFGGLNYQVEHHLFPSVPSFRLSLVQPIVKASLSEHCIPYQSASFLDAISAVSRHFRHIARGG